MVTSRADALKILLISQPQPSWDTIHKAYKKRSRQTHPDLGGNPDDFHLVQQAYEYLKDSRQYLLTYQGDPFTLGFQFSC